MLPLFPSLYLIAIPKRRTIEANHFTNSYDM